MLIILYRKLGTHGRRWPRLLPQRLADPYMYSRRVCSGKRALVQLVQLGVAKARLKPALSSATRVLIEGPLNNVQNNSFILVPCLYNNLLCILQNPDRILKKFWPNMPKILNKFRILFQNKHVIVYWISNPAAGRHRGGLLRNLLVPWYTDVPGYRN
jgi:hypothetical protein